MGRYLSLAIAVGLLSLGAPALGADGAASQYSGVPPLRGGPPGSGESVEAPAPAGSESSPSEATGATEEASQRFRRGIGFYEEGDFRLALIEFERAYQLVPNYRVLFNIGQVAISLGQFARARIAFERYLKEGADQIDEARRAAVERDLEMLRGKTATVELKSAQDGAEITLDDRPVGVAPLAQPLIVDAGYHRLRLTKDNYLPGEKQFTLAGGEALSVTLELKPEPERKAVLVVEQPKGPTPRPPEKARIAPLIAWITTGVLAAGTAGTWAAGASQAGQLNELRSHPDPDPARLDSVAASAKTLLVTGDVLAVATGTAAITSLFLQFYRPPKRESARSTEVDVSASPLGASLQISGKF